MNIFAQLMNIYSLFINMKNKIQRQLAIRKIISKGSIHSQEKLLYELKLKGFNLTQATLSRDLKSLKVAKIPDTDTGYTYIIPDSSGLPANAQKIRVNYLADGFKGVDFSGNIAVIRTLPGYASSIASVIDDANPWEIIGTLAGDDTILLVIKEGVVKSDIIGSLIQVMPNLAGKIK